MVHPKHSKDFILRILFILSSFLRGLLGLKASAFVGYKPEPGGQEMAHEMQSLFSEKRMATRINILKLMQELQGFAQMANARPQPPGAGAALPQLRGPKWRPQGIKPKRLIRIEMRDLPDIPRPVAINHLKPAEQPALGFQI